MRLLECELVTKRFGGLVAVDRVSLQVEAGEIVALVGPNGAGKTTLLNLVNGLLRPTSGRVRLAGRAIDRLSAPQIARLGVGRTFQVPRVFDTLTASEHVQLGTLLARSSLWPPRRGVVEDEVRRGLRFVRMEGRAWCLAGLEPPGRRKLLELAMVLATRPRLLLLDEPLAGLHPAERQFAVVLLQRVREERGVAVLWVEHDMEAVAQAADRVVVLHQGRKIADGPPREAMQHPEVVEAYLGGSG